MQKNAGLKLIMWTSGVIPQDIQLQVILTFQISCNQYGCLKTLLWSAMTWTGIQLEKGNSWSAQTSKWEYWALPYRFVIDFHPYGNPLNIWKEHLCCKVLEWWHQSKLQTGWETLNLRNCCHARISPIMDISIWALQVMFHQTQIYWSQSVHMLAYV